MARIIGIDLGTTNTAVAVLEGGRPRTLEDERGYKVLPSVVSAKGEGRFVVGQAASSLILTRPDRTVYATKRLIGRRYDSPEVQRVKERVHYLVREGPDGGVQLQVGDAWMSPQEVAAVVLQVARGIAEKALGETVEEAVITVPAHFNHAQRAATLEAAQLAGLRCDRLLNEPTAAALAYGHRKNIDRTLVVFDLGGGTFDVSVLRLRDGIYEILATSGDTFLGGEDFDYRVVDVLADGFAAKNGGLDLRKDKGSLQRLKDAAERAKCELSFSDRANVVVPHAAPGKNLETVLTRRQIEEATGDLVDKCVAIAREAVQSAGVPLGEVEEVILVGGMTRMPRVREAVAALFGREASRTVHPEEAVAVGAAVHAANLEDVDGPRPVLLDVAPFDLGIDAVGGHFSVIIAKNARVPCSESKVFATARDNQESVKVTVRQGESRTAADNEFLGEFVFDGLPPAPKLQTKVSVTFRIDQNGMLHVSASDPATGARRNITIRNYAEHAKSPEIAAVVEGGGGSAVAARLADALGPPRTEGATAPKRGEKKPGLLDMLLGRKKPAKAKAAPAAVPVAPAVEAAPVEPEGVEAEAVQAEPVEADPTDLGEMPEDDGPAPAIRLPAPSFLSEEEPIAADGLVELDEAVPLAPIEEDDLYGIGGGAGFGLAGASLGAGTRGGDLFSDPTPSDEGSLDASDLFGEAMGEEEEDSDLPTDHGARSPALAAPASRPAAAPARPVSPPVPDFDDETFSLPDDLGSLFDEAVAAVGSDVPEDVAEEPTPHPEPGPVMHRAPTGPTAASFDDAGSEDLGALLFGDDAGGPLLAHGAAADDGGVDFALPDEPTGFAFAEPEPEEPTGFALPEEDAFVVPVELAEPARASKGGRLDDEDLEAFAMPDDDPDVTRPLARKPKKPARIKLQYRDQAEFAAEYRLHLRDNAQFIRTDKPLPVGRACVFEIGAPGLAEPLVFDAVVDAVSDGRNGAEAGMRVAWRLDSPTRQRLERAVAGG